MNTLTEKRSNIRRFGKIAILGIIFGATLALMFALTALAEEPPESTETPTTTELDTTATTIPDVTTTTVPDPEPVVDETKASGEEAVVDETTLPEEEPVVEEPAVSEEEPVVDDEATPEEEPVVDDAAVPEEEPVVDEPATSASISTDKEDYFPGEIAQITGEGFLPGENVDIVIRNEAGAIVFAQTVIADENGSASSSFEVPVGANYFIDASGQSSLQIANNQFRDCNVWVTKTVDTFSKLNDFSLSKSANPEDINMIKDSAGEDITYEIDVTNNGNTVGGKAWYTISGSVTIGKDGSGNVSVTSIVDSIGYSNSWFFGWSWNSASDVDVDFSGIPSMPFNLTNSNPSVSGSYIATFSLPLSIDPSSSSINMKNKIKVYTSGNDPEDTVTKLDFWGRQTGEWPSLNSGNAIIVTDNEQLYLSDGTTPSTDLTWTVTDVSVNSTPSSDMDGPWTLNIPVGQTQQIVITKHVDADTVGQYRLHDVATTQYQDQAYADVNINVYDTLISGHKWADTNGNDLFDTGEGISGWSIYLNDGTLYQVSTGSDGYYEFKTIPLGSYNINEVIPSGWVNITPLPINVVLSMLSLSSTGNDIENFECPTLTVIKYTDVDGDYFKDVTDTVLSGWGISLDGSPLVNTNASGVVTYILYPGSHTVTEENRSGWSPTFTIGNTTFDAVSGQDVVIEFGNFQYGTVSGVKFNDLNGNGVKDSGEPGLGDWTIILDGYDIFGNWQSYNAITSSNPATLGQYSFTGLWADNTDPDLGWWVYEVGQTDWINTLPNVNYYPSGGYYYYYTPVISGSLYVDQDFGNYRLIEVSGYKYEDMNGNMQYDDGVDMPLPGWTIYLSKDGVPQPPATTGNDGKFTFTGLGPGAYVVSEDESVPNWVKTYEIGTLSFTASSGTNINDIKFGNFEYAKICGYKINDLNGDGILDLSEPGLPDWTITLIGTDSLGNPVDLSATTDVDGKYCFEGLWASDENGYTIAEVLQANWSQTYPLPIPPGNYVIVVTSGFGSWWDCDGEINGNGGVGETATVRTPNFGNVYVPPPTGDGGPPPGLEIAGITTEKHKVAGIEVAGITELPFTGSNMLIVYAIAILMIASGTAILSTTKKTRKNRA